MSGWQVIGAVSVVVLGFGIVGLVARVRLDRELRRARAKFGECDVVDCHEPATVFTPPTQFGAQPGTFRRCDAHPIGRHWYPMPGYVELIDPAGERGSVEGVFVWVAVLVFVALFVVGVIRNAASADHEANQYVECELTVPPADWCP